MGAHCPPLTWTSEAVPSPTVTHSISEQDTDVKWPSVGEAIESITHASFDSLTTIGAYSSDRPA